MKTHQGIQDAIGTVAREHICDPAMEEVIDILYALNDRIEDDSKQLKRAFDYIQELETKVTEVHDL